MRISLKTVFIEFSCLVCGMVHVCMIMALQFIDDDPGIKIHFTSADTIHNCLSLPSMSMVGLDNNVPRLVRGIGIKYNINYLI